MDRLKWIRRRARGIRRHFGVDIHTAVIEAAGDWKWWRRG